MFTNETTMHLEILNEVFLIFLLFMIQCIEEISVYSCLNKTLLFINNINLL